ncbi:hypothetical protein LCGC14_2923680 [marine sediment metagenome]|uniref:Uncharacterized protein n=1 Tax=marine sediment metagenome TaxID=412755 RepID=A0A0F8XND5_9ZZZZ
MILNILAYLILTLLAGGILFAIYDSRSIRFVFAVLGTIAAITWALERVIEIS